MTRTAWISAIFGSLAALAATQSCASQDAQTSEVGQEADGCGAGRYRGSANVDCRYQGERVQYTTTLTGTCLGDGQIKCTFNGTCQWRVERITDCVTGAPDCLSVYPPEGSLSNASIERTYDLTTGSVLCDPPKPAADLAAFCDANANSTIMEALSAECAAQTDRNEGGATCCLNCPKPPPPPPASPLLDDVNAAAVAEACAIAE
jgi:hypothetical protein